MSDIEADTISSGIQKRKKRPLLVDLVIRLVKEKPLGTVGGVIVLLMFLAGILADVISPYPMAEMHMADRLLGPSAQYWLGTDNLAGYAQSCYLRGSYLYGCRLGCPGY